MEKYRPYKDDEILDLVGEIACCRVDGSRYVIVEGSPKYSTVRLATITMSTDVLLREFTRKNGEPFGVNLNESGE